MARRITDVFRSTLRRVVIGPQSKARKTTPITHEILINREGRIGARIFEKNEGIKVLDFHVEGPQNRDWYFHYITNSDHRVTHHYTVLEDRVIKAVTDPRMNPTNQNSVRFTDIGSEELGNFIQATKLYHDRVLREVYNRDPKTGLALS
jgi:hypothetical protein